MFWPLVILAASAAFVGLDVLIITRDGLPRIVPSALAMVYQPALSLLVLALNLASAAFHDSGRSVRAGMAARNLAGGVGQASRPAASGKHAASAGHMAEATLVWSTSVCWYCPGRVPCYC
jgi:hypothetical protein